MSKSKNEKRGPTWEGLYTRSTKTRREKEIQEARKRKQNKWKETQEDWSRAK